MTKAELKALAISNADFALKLSGCPNLKSIVENPFISDAYRIELTPEQANEVKELGLEFGVNSEIDNYLNDKFPKQ